MKKLMIVSLIISVLLLIGFISMVSSSYSYNEKQPSMTVENYKALYLLGLAPSTQSRMPTEYDYDTNLRLSDGENNYALIESRTITKSDFGKTFLVRI